MRDAARQIETEIASWSGALSAEARYYWERHRPRYRYLLELLEELGTRHSFHRILDVGMGFQTVLLGKLFPTSRVDCLGVDQDERFRPGHDFTFHRVDLNDAATETDIRQACFEKFDLIVFMEVLEHLYTPPDIVLRYLASLLRPGGMLVVTTPNAAWLKNRLKLLLGRNPFEMLKSDRKNMGHVREYTKLELQRAITEAGLDPLRLERRGLYRFNNRKDNLYSLIADLTHPSLRRTLVAVCQKAP